MSFFSNISKPELPLRLGLGLMYLYSGYDLFFNTQHWYAFLPSWFSGRIIDFMAIETYLKAQGAAEFIMGILFLAWFLQVWVLRIISLLAVLEMALILVFVGIDLITFRDIGLLGAALALLFISFRRR